jgi:hypothetical protein
MSTLTPCPSCSRHVRVSDAACPFCGATVTVAPPGPAPAPGLRGRLGRAALFAAGATLMGLGACTDSKCAHLTCSAGVAGVSGGGTSGTTGSGGTTGSAGSGGAAGNDGGIDAVSPDDGPIAIYSAVFPPPEEAKTRAPFARAQADKTTPRT